jgi:hypothetical protein
MKRGYRQTSEHVRKRIAARLHTLRTKPKPLSAEELKRRYWGTKETCVDIAHGCGVDPKTVWAWMRFYGIPTRPRGSGSAVSNLIIGSGPANAFYGRKHSLKTKKRLSEISIADGRLPWGKNNPHPRLTGKNHPSWKGGCTPERQSFYASDEWKLACQLVWKRADAKCERCGANHREKHRRGTFHIHHVASFQVERLRSKPNNLVLLCKRCHRWVHSRHNKKGELITSCP